jgi:hypothetical protein
MGKATQHANEVIDAPLTAAEIEAREEAMEAGGEMQATLDGELVKGAGPSQAPIAVFQAPDQTWD